VIFIFRQRGVRHITINQHNMIIRIRLAAKFTIALFGASLSRCERPGDDRDFLTFA
jgi:hypothetical protein